MLATRRRSAAYEPIAAPVLQGERYRGRPIYFSDVIVRVDSGIGCFGDLRGHTFAVNERASHSGYGIVRYHLVTRGATRGFFGAVIESGAHQTSIRMVADGEVDASAIDSHVLALEMRDDASLGQRLRVIETLGPSTIQPVVASAKVPASLRARVRDLLLGLGDDPSARGFLDAGLIERFVAATASTYDDIREMVRAAEDAHFLVLR